MTKPSRISSYADCAKCRALIDQGKAMLVKRRNGERLELIVKTASGADLSIVDPKYESQFADYAGRWRNSNG